VVPKSHVEGLEGGHTMNFPELLRETDPNYAAMFFVIAAYLALMAAFIVH
jgi:hypothetical protein